MHREAAPGRRPHEAARPSDPARQEEVGARRIDARSSFQDHFSERAADYARFRPTYPAALFAWLAGLAPGRDRAWDCGTGNGQAACALAAHFADVRATDPSERQLAHATPHPRVTYRVGTERDSGLPPSGTDLVTAAQAFHWFDGPAFFREAARVLRPGGALAIWCYGLCRVDDACDAVLRHFHGAVVGPDWPPGRALVEAGYRDVVMPFAEVAAPAFAIEATLTLEALCRYVATWSAVERHRARTGRDPVPALAQALAGPWGTPGTARAVRWPIHLRVARR